MKNQIQFDNINFSNLADVPIMLLLLIACQNEEFTENCKKYLKEYKERMKHSAKNKQTVFPYFTKKGEKYE